jgi:hypothetical protein
MSRAKHAKDAKEERGALFQQFQPFKTPDQVRGPFKPFRNRGQGRVADYLCFNANKPKTSPLDYYC